MSPRTSRCHSCYWIQTQENCSPLSPASNFQLNIMLWRLTEETAAPVQSGTHTVCASYLSLIKMLVCFLQVQYQQFSVFHIICSQGPDQLGNHRSMVLLVYHLINWHSSLHLLQDIPPVSARRRTTPTDSFGVLCEDDCVLSTFLFDIRQLCVISCVGLFVHILQFARASCFIPSIIAVGT